MTKKTLVTTRASSWIAIALVVGSTVGCGSATETEGAQPSDGSLALGSRGAEVRSTYEYLKRYGYFENPELRHLYPNFVPIVSQPPTDPNVFDEHLRKGVLAFQRLSGLSATGVVDEPMRKLMATPRCAHPDVDPEQLDPSQKWALSGPFYRTNLTFGFENFAAGLGEAPTRAAVTSALNTWTNASDLTFAEVDPSLAAIQIGFFSGDNVPAWASGFPSFDGPGAVAGRTSDSSISGRSQVAIDDDEPWSVATPTPADSDDLESVALHELGHALGLSHSSVGQPVMYPYNTLGASKRALFPDDRQAIGALYESWDSVNGRLREVAVSGGSAYGLGTSAVPGGYPVMVYVNSQTPGGYVWATIGSAPGAVHLAVSAQGPWLVNSSYQIYANGFRRMPGSARDIAANGSSVWSVSNTPGSGGWMVQQWDASAQNWIQSDIAGARIAVAPGGLPWVVQTDGSIYRKNATGWELLPGHASDLDVGADGSVWAISGDFVLIWDEQAQLVGSDGIGVARPVKKWVFTFGAPANVTSVAVGPDGRPWITDSAFKVYRRRIN